MCSSALRTFGRLRCPELRPEIDTFPEPGELRTAVAGVVRKRRTLLGDIPLKKPCEVNRVLICEYNMSLSSGQAESVSNGIFDIHDHPPWDTWIAYSKAPPAGAYPDGLPLIISYVPRRHHERVAVGISTNPYECVYWGELIP